MVDTGLACDVDIFAQLHVSLGAKNGDPAVAPIGQAVGGKPVDADVAGDVIGPQQHFAEILQFRVVRIGAVGDRSTDDPGIECVGEKQELFALMRGDVGQYAAGALA